ncbi:SH2B adapter protein 2-like isoform X2 [Bacillus rossius redtenbacheri]|uniref:SH2B adapter protein 2-like isoform X2 n=1 Tax=Bacillus rossius redtenbacheri TaxID=93214 RepID=UPI002FDE87C8
MASVNASNDDSLSWVEFCEKYAKIAASDFAKAFCAYLRGNISEDARTTVARSDFVRKFVDIFVEHFEAEYSKKHPYNRENEKITNGIQESVNLNRNVLGNSNDEFSDYSEHEGDSPSPKIQQKTFFRRLSFKGLTKGKGLFHKQHSDEVELSSHRTNKHSKYNKHSKTKLAKIVVECRKEGIVNYLIGENMDGTQKWEKCRLALVKTVGGYMLEFYSPLKSLVSYNPHTSLGRTSGETLAAAPLVDLSRGTPSPHSAAAAALAFAEIPLDASLGTSLGTPPRPRHYNPELNSSPWNLRPGTLPLFHPETPPREKENSRLH